MTSADYTAARRDNVHAETASTLWLERELLERLLFALTCQKLVLSTGAVRWLPPADEQVCTAVDALSDCELKRAIGTTELALLLDLPGDATLDVIADRADAPWNELLAQHRKALRALADEIATTTGEVRRLLVAGARLIDSAEATATVEHGSRGAGYRSSSSGPTNAVLFDQQA